ncbi:hypothetical protein [Streptomyces sp. CBMA123]|uniref:hypothetical protein n=1 Tax=Streptomyces sp. CBMA123 TaxID=1896313 RepID=UPI001661AFD1|nr:hypothetical protein [Streptomyces sp. CBMA123]MBD0691032.1 hypothetical protein [Streptomyces sp. CBMA123]
MSGQQPGPYGGPTPGAPPYGPGPVPGAVPGSFPAAGPAPIPGRFGPAVRVLCALVPLLSFGVLGAVPALLLAVRRRRAYDVLGAVVFCGLLLTLIVCAGIAGSLHDATANLIGEIALGVLWLTPTAHYLAMDSCTVWEAGRTAPVLLAPPAAPPAAASYGPPYGYVEPASYGGTAPTVPGYGAPAPAPAPAVETAHDLRELGELLRRQAREGGS